MTTLYRYVFRSSQICNDEMGFYNWPRLFPDSSDLDIWDIHLGNNPFGYWYSSLNESTLNVEDFRYFFTEKGRQLFLINDFAYVGWSTLKEFCKEYYLDDLQFLCYEIPDIDWEQIPSNHKDEYQCVLSLEMFENLEKKETLLWSYE